MWLDIIIVSVTIYVLCFSQDIDGKQTFIAN